MAEFVLRFFSAVLILFAVSGAVGQHQRADKIPVDLELVIAVDVSASMGREEFALQRYGYVAAIRHPDFLRAIAGGPYGRIALSYVEWSGSRLQPVVIAVAADRRRGERLRLRPRACAAVAAAGPENCQERMPDRKIAGIPPCVRRPHTLVNRCIN